MKEVDPELKEVLAEAARLRPDELDLRPVELSWYRRDAQRPLRVEAGGTIFFPPLPEEGGTIFLPPLPEEGGKVEVEVTRNGEPYTYEITYVGDSCLDPGVLDIELAPVAELEPEHPAAVAAEGALRRICQAQADRAERLYQDAVMQAIRDVARGG